MIFLLSNIYDDEVFGSPLFDSLIADLINADRLGLHYVVIDRTTCDNILKCSDLSRRDRSHLTKISQTYSTRGGIVNAERPYCRIIIGDRTSISVDQNEFVIGHKLLINGDWLRAPSKLVVENKFFDGAFYEYLFKLTLNRSCIPQCRFELVHAGGEDLCRVFEGEVKNTYVTVSIVDHDKISPYSKSASTFNKVKTFDRQIKAGNRDDLGPYIGAVFDTYVREAENIIPFKYYADYYQETNIETISFLYRVLDNCQCTDGIECFWMYFDVKKGFSGSQLEKKRSNREVNQETIDWLSEMVLQKEGTLADMNIAGFGDGVLRKFNELSDTTSKEAYFNINCHWRKSLFRRLEYILWFFCSSQRSRF